jgi:hypothetical protein
VKRRAHLAAPVAALLLLLLAAAAARGFGPSAIPHDEGKLAYDCAGGASLAPGSRTSVDWVVWCGPVSGRMRVQVRAPMKAERVRWGVAPRVTGSGGRPDCRESRDELTCHLRKSGPVTIRGSLTLPGGACVGKTVVAIPTAPFREGEPFFAHPWGCPGNPPPRPPKLRSILRFRAAEALDPGSAGNHAALTAKARQLRQAWIDEEPVERWSWRAWRSPLDAKDAKLMALRGHAIEQADELIEGWVERNHARDTYAGWTWGTDGSIYVGFTKEPEATVARMKRKVAFVEPAFVKPFPVAPNYTDDELNGLTEKVIDATTESGEDTYGIIEVGIDVLANKVRVAAEHVGATTRLLTERFGPDAPIEVEHSRATGELL